MRSVVLFLRVRMDLSCTRHGITGLETGDALLGGGGVKRNNRMRGREGAVYDKRRQWFRQIDNSSAAILIPRHHESGGLPSASDSFIYCER